jgi:hypothetical protein
MEPFANNKELYEYLVHLASELGRRGSPALSALVTSASRHLVDMSTEFLGESRIALQKVSQGEKGILTADERADLMDVLRQLDTALDKR